MIRCVLTLSDVHDLCPVEHRRRHALVHAIRQRLHERLGDVGQLQRRDVGEAEIEHPWSQLERATVGADVAERDEGVQEAACGRSGEAGGP